MSFLDINYGYDQIYGYPYIQESVQNNRYEQNIMEKLNQGNSETKQNKMMYDKSYIMLHQANEKIRAYNRRLKEKNNLLIMFIAFLVFVIFYQYHELHSFPHIISYANPMRGETNNIPSAPPNITR